MLATIPVLLWVYSHPLAGAITLSGAAGLFVVGRHVSRLVRCLRDCREFAFTLGEIARITVSRIPAEKAR